MTNAEKFSTIRFEENGGIARIILDRPRVLNAIDPEMVLELNTAMDRVAKDDAIKVVVVSGEGRAFSAGFDLKASAARGPLTIAQWRQVLEDDLDLVLRFWDCPKPTIAAIHGYCIGGAFEVALACDISIAAESSLLGEPEVVLALACIRRLNDDQDTLATAEIVSLVTSAWRRPAVRKPRTTKPPSTSIRVSPCASKPRRATSRAAAR